MTTKAITKTQQKAGTQLKEWLNSDQFKTEIARILPAHLKSERFIRIALNASLTTPKLADCTKASVFKCLLDLAALGIEPNGRDAHLIPFEDRRNGVTICQLVVDFKGLVQIVKRAPGVVSVHADVVRANDDFEFQQGTDAFLRHRFGFDDRGAIVGAYSNVKTTTGDSFVVLTLEEIKAVQKGSRAGGSGPWVTHFAEMAKKTAFRRHTKWLSLPAEVAAAIEQGDPEKPAGDPRFPDSAAQTIDLSPTASREIEQPDSVENPENFGAATHAAANAAPPRRTGNRKPAEKPPGRQYSESDGAALRGEFGAILKEAGANFDDFQTWARQTGIIKDADAAASVDDLPIESLVRCVNARAGLVEQLKAAKGAA
jgi:recombination protein RecT